MMVFHEASFRERFENLMASTYVAAPQDNNGLWLIMLVLGLGAHYSSLISLLPQEKLDMQQLSRDLLNHVEHRFVNIIDSADEEAVQICILMGSYFLFNGRPNAGLGILGSGIKIAQVLRLHRENLTAEPTDAFWETRRRSWWALEVFDKYASIAFGRPCGIDDPDIDVNTVSEVWSAAGDPQREPNLDYHKWKFDLYRIMGPFLGRRVQTNCFESIKHIHTKLLIWWSELPQSLRLGTYEGGFTPAGSPSLPMQALALQLTYDNFQIVLHRRVAFQPHAAASVLAHTGISANPTMCAVSREQLLESVLRTSDVYKFPNLLLACRKTHAAMHVGICLFTAGVVLCALAFSDPLSTTSQNAKRGVMNILRLQHNHALWETLLSTQSLKIIEELVAAVMRSEQRLIRGDIDKPSPRSSLSSNANRLPSDDRIINNHASGVTQDNPLLDTTSRELSGGLLDQLPDSQSAFPSQPSPFPAGPQAGLLVGSESTLLSMDPMAGLVWNGDNPYLFDPAFADASQLYLWSDTTGSQPFPNPQ